LYGKTSFEWLFIELLFVPELLRGRGIGSKLVKMAEKEAIIRNCPNAWLDTFEFQAREFYEKLGYQVFAELPNFPRNHKRFFLKKSLTL
jgi:GNAT superfamily N-acetyltransferase